MILQDFLPSASLRGFVKCYRIVHFCFDNNQKVPTKAYPPKPEQTLHFFLKEPFVVETAQGGELKPPSILFTAQQSSLVRHIIQQDFWDVQIVFQPTAVYQLTGIPANEVVNRFLDATAIFSKNIKSTFSQLQEASGYAELINIAEAFTLYLVRNARKEPLLLDDACKYMVHQQGNISLEWLAKESCYCTKQFKRKFAERVGLNPKTYTRILRLNRAYNVRNCFPDKEWSLIAAQCGYVDYQHLTKDYKDFTGLTPRELHLLESQSPENFLGIAKPLYRSRYIVPGDL
jgi:AraC-like DNA-binding protein